MPLSLSSVPPPHSFINESPSLPPTPSPLSLSNLVASPASERERGEGRRWGRGGRREGGDIRGIETAISFVYLIDRRLKRSLSLLFIKILRFEINKRER